MQIGANWFKRPRSRRLHPGKSLESLKSCSFNNVEVVPLKVGKRENSGVRKPFRSHIRKGVVAFREFVFKERTFHVRSLASILGLYPHETDSRKYTLVRLIKEARRAFLPHLWTIASFRVVLPGAPRAITVDCLHLSGNAGFRWMADKICFER